MNNEGAHQYLTSLFSGTMKPIKRKMSATPAFNQSVIIGKDGDLFSRARVWVYEPTVEYPEISVMFQLKNASGSCFTKLTIDDLQELQSKLADWIAGIQAVYPGLTTKLAQVNGYIDQYNQYIEVANQFRAAQENGQPPILDEEQDNDEDSTNYSRSRGKSSK